MRCSTVRCGAILCGAVPCCGVLRALLYLLFRACSIIIPGPSGGQLGSSYQLSSAAHRSASSAPQRGARCRAVRCCAVLCCAVPCCAVLCRAVPCCAVLCRAVPCCSAVRTLLYMPGIIRTFGLVARSIILLQVPRSLPQPSSAARRSASSAAQRSAVPYGAVKCRALRCGAVLCRAVPCCVLCFTYFLVDARYHSKYHVIPGTGTTISTPPGLLELLRDIAESQKRTPSSALRGYCSAAQRRAVPYGAVPGGAVRCRAFCPAVWRCAVLRCAFFRTYSTGYHAKSTRYKVPVCTCIAWYSPNVFITPEYFLHLVVLCRSSCFFSQITPALHTHIADQNVA